MATLSQIWKDKKLLKRILITIGLLLLFRMGTQLTLPGVTVDSVASDDSFFSLMNTLSGGGLNTFSIFALGVSPYITASIIIQLLSSDVVPAFSKWKKEGESGKVKMEKATRISAVVIGVIQAVAIALAFSTNGYISISTPFSETGTVIIYSIILTAGTMMAIWIADLITKNGIGNGTSLIIFAGIAAQLPAQVVQQFNYNTTAGTSSEVLIGALNFIGIILMFIMVILLVSFFYESERRLPLQQTGKTLKSSDKNVAPYLPIKVNVSGVVPVIFASAVVTLIPTIAQFLPESSSARYWMVEIFSFSNWYGLVIYASFIMLFTFFYGHVSIDPETMAKNFKNSGTFILGVKPGKDTEKTVARTVNNLCLVGGVYLAFIATLPYMLSAVGITAYIPIGGTSLIIMVGVAIDTYKNISARLVASTYKTSITSSKKRTEERIEDMKDTNEKSKDDDSMSDLII